VLGPDSITSMSNAPLVYHMMLVYDRTIPERSIEKVNTLKYFLKSFLELMEDETSLNALRGLIDQCTQDREVPTTQRTVNQVSCKKRTNIEFKLSV
jgi:hypothetical protein